jgi:hypothetical protein
MTDNMFVKAVKGKKPLRLVLSGASGSGKSYTAGEFCKYLEKKTSKRTAAVDTEHGRLSLYADKFDFDVIEMEPPFHPNRLIEAIKNAELSGYGQLIVDSSTHYWNGSGGVLEIVNDAAKSRFGGNIYAGWAVGTPLQNEVIDTIIRSPMHIIFTTRAKQEYVEGERNNKKTYEKVGLGMVQREGFEFDFDFAIMMDMDNNGLVTKGMGVCPPNTYFKHPSEEAIEQIMKSITENSVEVEPKTINKVITLATELGGSKNEELMKILKTFEPSGNPKKIKDETVLKNLLSSLTIFKEEQENKSIESEKENK